MGGLVIAVAMVLAGGDLANGGFASGTSGWARATYGAEPSVSVSESGNHGGTHTLRIEADQPSDTAFGQDVAVSAGKLYQLSGWVKTEHLNPMGAQVSGTIQAQAPGGAAILATGANHTGDTSWTQESVYFVAPTGGKAHIALFFCGWGKGTGAVSFDNVQLKQVDEDNLPMKVTRQPLTPGRISPMQYGQFIEYLCDLVPSMWAEKLYDGSFEGLSPYKFVFVKETDFKEQPWYPYGERNRLTVDGDTSTSISGPTSKRIRLSDGSPCEGGIAQDGISLNKGIGCKFSIYAKATAPGQLRVRLFQGEIEYAQASLHVGTSWTKLTANLVPKDTITNATISLTFEGPRTVWLDSASLMPEDSVGGWRKDVFVALKSLKPGIVRLGGSVLDDPNLGTFEWTDTIGDPDRRRPFRSWGGLQPTGPGMEELVQLIQGVGAEPLICLRYEKKTPQDAANEVEYFNGATDTRMGALRAKNGHPKPYGVKYWQIGNERWGDAYWQAVPLFARAIRKVDPNVKLLSSFPSEELVKLAAGDVDYVSPHQYDVADLGGSLRELEDTRRMIRDFGGGKSLKLGVTEWNTTAGDAGLGRAKLWSLENALACSRYQNLLHREADLVEIANRSNLTNSFCSGIIQTSRSGIYFTPTFFAQQLYATMAGTRPLRIESPMASNVSPDVSATLSEDGQWLSVFVVNDRLQPVTRALDLSALVSGPLKVEQVVLEDTLHEGHPDATNGFESPLRISPMAINLRFPSAKFKKTFAPLSLTVLRVRVSG